MPKTRLLVAHQAASIQGACRATLPPGFTARPRFRLSVRAVEAVGCGVFERESSALLVVPLKAGVGAEARDERFVPRAISGDQRGCDFAIEDVDRTPEPTGTFHSCLACSNSC